MKCIVSSVFKGKLGLCVNSSEIVVFLVFLFLQAASNNRQSVASFTEDRCTGTGRIHRHKAIPGEVCSTQISKEQTGKQQLPLTISVLSGARTFTVNAEIAYWLLSDLADVTSLE